MFNNYKFKQFGGLLCKKGTILRSSYYIGDTKVEASCIPDTGLPGKYKTKVNKQTKISAKKQKLAMKLLKNKSKKCKKGEIAKVATIRKKYKRKDGTLVKRTVIKASCIKDKGLPGKSSKKIVILKEDKLGKYGYKDVTNLTIMQRHRALMRAVRDNNYLYAIRALVGRSNLLIRTNPVVSKIFKKDQEWLSKKYKESKITF